MPYLIKLQSRSSCAVIFFPRMRTSLAFATPTATRRSDTASKLHFFYNLLRLANVTLEPASEMIPRRQFVR